MIVIGSRHLRIVSYVFLTVVLLVTAVLAVIYRESPKARVPYWGGLGKRVMVVAPHPDDESLGTAGVIARATAENRPVRVVMITCGDSFFKAAQIFAHKNNPVPQDYRRMGVARHLETLKAMHTLGLAEKDVVFLGYPDGGTRFLWDAYWDRGHPRVSGGVNVDRVPYSFALRPGAPYCGQDVVDDLTREITDFKPTDIYYPTSLDEHPDHWATAAYVKYTLTMLDLHPREHTYLVHRYLWPQPPAPDAHMPLLPPAELANLTHWDDFPLTPAEIRLKNKALHDYPTQEAVMKPFLWAFVRKTELFGSPAALPLTGGDAAPPAFAAWRTKAVLPDARADTVQLTLEGAVDIIRLRLQRQGNRLWMRLETREPVSPKVAYFLHFRLFGPGRDVKRIDLMMRGGKVEVLHKAGNSLSPAVNYFASRRNMIVLAVDSPETAKMRVLMAGAESRYGRGLFDRTAWRLFRQ
ncbi:PIG-L deacetylase family protein [Desulfotomaculum copahuensis]|uniref:LmbE family protein n=1 Tax=Desulfotomaculum copahuensis TaxID=1838280 RepID=A0A1B7LJK4_9FIRM|nr:PIG-L family deacetylase [Desulfotomaculum copahuensis]OAT86661.1 hypothetical protein A6M21_16510 [Desulfotomaculum copahuensis]